MAGGLKGDAGSKVTTVFPLGATLKEMKPGAYVIKVRDASGGRDIQSDDENEGTPPAQARRWIMFTDMALMSYTGQGGLDVVVRSLKTSKTLGGVTVTLVAKDGEDLGAPSPAARRELCVVSRDAVVEDDQGRSQPHRVPAARPAQLGVVRVVSREAGDAGETEG